VAHTADDETRMSTRWDFSRMYLERVPARSRLGQMWGMLVSPIWFVGLILVAVEGRGLSALGCAAAALYWAPMAWLNAEAMWRRSHTRPTYATCQAATVGVTAELLVTRADAIVRGVPTLRGCVTGGDERRPQGWPGRGVMG
jgi:hypothetical protein